MMMMTMTMERDRLETRIIKEEEAHSSSSS
jgi:hypothetical protein